MRWVFCLFVLAGCASNYSEPRRAGTSATIEAVAPIWIIQIDSKPVPRAGFTGDKQFFLSPGAHVIKVQFSGSERAFIQTWRGNLRETRAHLRGNEPAFISFTAQPQHHYFVHAGRTDLQLWSPYISEQPPGTFNDWPVR